MDVNTGILANELSDKSRKKLGIYCSLFLIYSQDKTERSKIYFLKRKSPPQVYDKVIYERKE